MSEVLTVPEVAAMLRVSTWTVAAMTRDGRLPRVPGLRRTRIPQAPAASQSRRGRPDGRGDRMRVEAAADMGFKREPAEQAMAILDACAISVDFDVAMDLARFVRISLPDAAMALCNPRGLRRLGFAPDVDVRAEVAGMAAVYSATWLGKVEISEAHGHTFSAAFWRLYESVFGPRLGA